MADDDVLDRPAEYLPEEVRREMERMKRQQEAAPAGPVHAQAKVVTLERQAGQEATPPAEPGPAKPEDDPPPSGAGPASFDPAAADYKAFGWAGNHTLPTLLLIFGDGREKPIVYAQLDSDPDPDGSEFLAAAPGRKGSLIRLRVAGAARMFFVVIEGGDIRQVWELIMAHKTPWIRVLPPGGVPVKGEPVIWSIRFEPAK